VIENPLASEADVVLADTSTAARTKGKQAVAAGE